MFYIRLILDCENSSEYDWESGDQTSATAADGENVVSGAASDAVVSGEMSPSVLELLEKQGYVTAGSMVRNDSCKTLPSSVVGGAPGVQVVGGGGGVGSSDNPAEAPGSGQDDPGSKEKPQPPQTKAMHLLDAHIIFEPLLSSLGLMPQQLQNLSLKNLGSNISVLANVDVFTIDIVESEYGRIHRSKRGRTGGSRRRATDSDLNSPSFLCEKVYLQVHG